MCELAQLKKLHISPYHPETNGQCEHFNATLINMLGTLPTHAKKNWQEWVTTLTHAYNCTVSSVTGFSPYFLMFVQTPKIPLAIEMGMTLIEQGKASHQNYAKKLQARLKWAYQKAQENSQKESECHKKYYDKKMRCMFVQTPKIPLAIEMGMTLIEQGKASHQNYAKKLQARLKWAYQKAQENSQKESECHKKYYDKKMRCISLKPGDLVLVHAKAPSGNYKIADQWEDIPHQVLSQLADQPVTAYRCCR